jgi:hypothetical protein
VRVVILLFLALALTSSVSAQKSGSSVLRKIFKAIPSDYFSIACCDGNADEFIKKYVTIEDNTNGYMAGADTQEDPQYSSFELALFPRPDGSYLVGFHSEAQRWSDYYFLDYRSGKLRNISKMIPLYSLENVYELPRQGKTIHVYRKKYDHAGRPLGADNSVKKGKALYDLVWENGKFVVKQKR